MILTVEFLDERRELSPGDELTFGRSGTLVIDENPYLHRVLGHLVHHSGLWWLRNVGEHVVMEAVDHDGAGAAHLRPGDQHPITRPLTTVRFVAGRHHYAVELVL